MLDQRVCIVGAGLMGGSLALALRPFLSHLTLVDTHPPTLAVIKDIADETTADFAVGIRHAELLILATPAQTIIRLLEELPHRKPDGCQVLDLGSTKADICRAMAQLPPTFQAIGGHPMCGKETAGFAAASPDLYRHQLFILCRISRTTPELEHLTFDILTLLGATPLFLDPDEHDELVAAVSHLPYLVSAVLMQTVADLPYERLWEVSASGFRDVSRLAGSDPRMMLDILLTNRTAVLTQLETYQSHLAELKALLLANDGLRLVQWLAETQRQYRWYQQKKSKQ